MPKGSAGRTSRRPPVTSPTKDTPKSAVHPNVTLEMVLDALASNQRTTRAIYRLMRDIADQPSAKTARQRRSSSVLDLDQLAIPASPDTRDRLDSSPAEPAATLPLIQVRYFGRFEVLRDGTPVQHWRRGKAKTLLKYLVARRQPVVRDVLLDLFWPDAEPRLAVNGLRVALHALRQTLGPCNSGNGDARQWVLLDGGNYLLNPRARLWVDADEFTANFETGRRLERQQETAEAMGHYEAAEALYRDDYLLEDVYEDWTAVRREELKDQYLMILTKLADYCLQVRDAEGCIVRCHRILAKDPCREDAYQRLMRCYAQLGQRSQALHWYNVCARTLRRELDVAPSAHTVNLCKQITAGSVVSLQPR